MKALHKKSARFAVGAITLALLLAQSQLCYAQTSQDATGTKPAVPAQSSAIEGQQRQGIRIGAGDLLEITVLDVPELTQAIRVTDTGSASFNLIGQLHLQGLSTDEARLLVAKKLREGNYILEPQVSILIREYGTQGVSVTGEVRRPGIYQVLGKRRLLDVISEAGGVTAVASHEATIQRRSGTQQTITASLSNNPSELLASNLELEPGDTIIVPRAGIFYALGDVGRPGGFVMQNSGRVTLLQAIAYAAGANRTASDSNLKIIRKNATGLEEIKINLKAILKGKNADVELKAEDILYVPQSGAKALLARAPALAQSAASAVVYQAIP
jgi:polysaccharide biosynthesis/export protein